MLETLLAIWPVVLIILGLSASWGVAKYRIDKHDQLLQDLLKDFNSRKVETDQAFAHIHSRCANRAVEITSNSKDVEIELSKINTKLDVIQKVVDESKLAILGTKIEYLAQSFEEFKYWFKDLEARTHKLETIIYPIKKD